LKYLQKVRHRLHAHPELSGDEAWTSAFITEELKKTQPDRLLTGLGGYGVAAVYGPSGKGAKVLVRAELDGLPIADEGKAEYKSQRSGKSHACGHDGHMTVMLGIARYLKENRPESGQVTVLFQPAEETGEGASRLLGDPQFEKIEFDRAYAFHNLPGYKEGTLIVRDDVFASASVGLICTFRGESSHAAYPEQGRPPAPAVAGIIDFLEKAGEPDISSRSYAIGTVTYVKIGEKAFGISPGIAEMGITFRAAGDDLLEDIRSETIDKLHELSKNYSLDLETEEIEPFMATINARECTGNVKKAAHAAGINIEESAHPFPWSEDFGRFSQVSDIALVGIGAGIDHPHLHAGNFDFNDRVIQPALNLFIHILKTEFK
jgi:amidohydrolase